MRDKIILYRSGFRDRPTSDSDSDGDENMQTLSPPPRRTRRARQELYDITDTGGSKKCG